MSNSIEHLLTDLMGHSSNSARSSFRKSSLPFFGTLPYLPSSEASNTNNPDTPGNHLMFVSKNTPSMKYGSFLLSGCHRSCARTGAGTNDLPMFESHTHTYLTVTSAKIDPMRLDSCGVPRVRAALVHTNWHMHTLQHHYRPRSNVIVRRLES